MYSGFFSNTSYRAIFFYTQLLAAVFAFSDIILIYRWNKSIHIPDSVFLIGLNGPNLGSQTIINTIYSLQGMPFLVMAAQLCPVDIEATFYAAMMSLSNTGGGISSLWGGYLLTWLHVVRIPDMDTVNSTLTNGTVHYDFTNLPNALWIRIVAMIIPAFLVLCMIPNTSQVGTEELEFDSFVGGSSDYQALRDDKSFDGGIPLQVFDEENEI